MCGREWRGQQPLSVTRRNATTRRHDGVGLYVRHVRGTVARGRRRSRIRFLFRSGDSDGAVIVSRRRRLTYDLSATQVFVFRGGGAEKRIRGDSTKSPGDLGRRTVGFSKSRKRPGDDDPFNPNGKLDAFSARRTFVTNTDGNAFAVRFGKISGRIGCDE